MPTHTHQAILHGFLIRILRGCRIPHEEETTTTTPFKQGTIRGSGYLRMSLFMGSAALFQGKDALKSSPLMFDVTLANPLELR